jgi:DNA polymerase-3 subunit epsilon
LRTPAEKAVRIWLNKPVRAQRELKTRRYRWSSGDEGRPKAWYVDVDEAKRDDEIAYLRKFICLRDVDDPNLRVSLLKADLKIINHPR